MWIWMVFVLKEKSRLKKVIKLNKPLEEMKDEVWMGMGWRELIYAAIGVIVAGVIIISLAFVVKLSPVICVYIGVPCAAPIVIMGMYKKQGLTIWQSKKKKSWQKKVGVLIYEAREMPDEIFVWSMKRK